MRLIDADALINSTDKERVYKYEIVRAPTVDAVERKRGEWIKQMDEQAWWYECSVCGDYPLKNAFGHESLSRFCPWCGAYMRGEAND